MPTPPMFDPPPKIDLLKSDTWPDAVHVFDPKSTWAIRAALACRRPLLVRGEPGIGKSQLARAAAAALKWPFLYHVVHARTEPDDLLFSFDAVGRLAQAQIQRYPRRTNALNVGRFVRPGPFWWAIHWNDATRQQERYQTTSGAGGGAAKPFQKPPEWEHSENQGCVLLVDEIDKAESDIPNALLESLGNHGFQVPVLGHCVRVPENHQPPLVIFTTNEDRDLPPAFLRRCLVLNLEWEEGEWATKAVERAEAHLRAAADLKGDTVSADLLNLLKPLAEKFSTERKAVGRGPGLWRPGTAEFIDLALTLENLKNKMGPQDVSKLVEEFFIQKNPKNT